MPVNIYQVNYEIDSSDDDDDEAGDVVAKQIARMHVRSMVKYAAVATDASTRRFTEEEVAKGVTIAKGDLAREYETNPFTDITESLNLMVFSREGEEVHGIVEYKRNDQGMPEMGDATITTGTIGSGSDECASILRDYLARCASPLRRNVE